MIRVLCAVQFSDELLQRLQQVSSELQIEQVPLRLMMRYLQDPQPTDPEHVRLEQLLQEADVLYTYRIPTELDKIPRVHWIQLAIAGADRLVDHPIWNRDGIRITTTSGIHAVPIAEYVLGSMMAFARQAPRLWEHQQHKEWAKWRWAQTHIRELRGATIGIVGYGSIGREVARLARAFGMRVLATKRDPLNMRDHGYREPGVGDPEGALPEKIYRYDQLSAMLPLCDYVVLTLPLTPATRGMIDADALRTMRPNTYLVNIARGEIVVEPDLVRALKEGWIAGAGAGCVLRGAFAGR